jgi:hypothetical protein
VRLGRCALRQRTSELDPGHFIRSAALLPAPAQELLERRFELADASKRQPRRMEHR